MNKNDNRKYEGDGKRVTLRYEIITQGQATAPPALPVSRTNNWKKTMLRRQKVSK